MQSEEKSPNNLNLWYLESVADANRGWIVALETFPFIIGRDTDCHLKLTDIWISRHHSEIRLNGDLLWIRDLDSKNGTFLNQEQIKQAELLEPGDTISIGKFKFIVKRMEGDIEEAPEDTCFLSDKLNYPASMETCLRKLIRSRNVVPHYQRVLHIADERTMGYEILGRIKDNTLPDNPKTLFDMADWFECAFELSTLFREVGVELGGQLPGAPVLFVNVTPFEIDQMDLLLPSLEKTRQMAPDTQLVIEINEKAVNNTEEMTRLRQTLKRLQMGLAFDDFGVGQTRLVELAKVPPDFLKFDISLIRNIHLAPTRLHQMVYTFVKAAQDLGVQTIAEGVECAEEAETCRQLGFNLVQGFFYGRPQPLDEIQQADDPD